MSYEEDGEDGDTIIADDLSLSEDNGGGTNTANNSSSNNNNNMMTSGEALERQYAKRRYHTWMSVLIISTFLCSILITSVKFFAPGPNNRVNKEVDIFGAGSGNGMNSDENQRRLSDTLNYLVTKDVSDIMTLLPNNTMSPQYLAARWIATIDSHQLNIPKVDGSTSKDEYPFLQRYSLAVLFLSIGGLRWKFNLNFLSGTHECAWFQVFSSPELPPDQGELVGS